jgi:hypothetical protein
MRDKFVLSILPLLALLLALVPTSVASDTWYVNGVNGNDSNPCKSSASACKTIGHAISLASSGDSIMVGAATYGENLTIDFSLTIVGAGASTTIIDGGSNGTVVTISGTKEHVTLSRVTIRNGLAKEGGGIYNSVADTLQINDSVISQNTATSGVCTVTCLAEGGGIFNEGSLTFNNSTLSRNTISTSCRSVCFILGGGIYNGGGTVTVNRSTLNGNSAVEGGGIYNIGIGTVMMVNSTLQGNSANGSGGAIFSYTGSLTINNSTLSGNSAFYGGGGIFNSSGSTALLQNSIVAYSSFGGNCVGAVTSIGYNLSSDNTCNFKMAGDLNNTDPMLGPLQDNRGATWTEALLAGSPAIDAGNPSGCTDGRGHLLKTDQRGEPRPDEEDHGVGCDMGAFERQSD